MILTFPGMRPTEFNNLRWSDVLGYGGRNKKTIGERFDQINLRVHGKKAEGRTIIPVPAITLYFDVFRDYWKDKTGSEPDQNDFVLTNPETGNLRSFSKGFNELLEATVRGAKWVADHEGAEGMPEFFEPNQWGVGSADRHLGPLPPILPLLPKVFTTRGSYPGSATATLGRGSVVGLRLGRWARAYCLPYYRRREIDRCILTVRRILKKGIGLHYTRFGKLPSCKIKTLTGSSDPQITVFEGEPAKSG